MASVNVRLHLAAIVSGYDGFFTFKMKTKIS